ncbi:MAG: hypothetical protein VB913_16875 [Rhodospirillales bacterium]|jgi:hypothetical protein
MAEKLYRVRVIEERKQDRRSEHDRRKVDRRYPEPTACLTPEEIAALLVTH